MENIMRLKKSRLLSLLLAVSIVIGCAVVVTPQTAYAAETEVITGRTSSGNALSNGTYMSYDGQQYNRGCLDCSVLFDTIAEVYGQDAAEAYSEAIQTGDYYKYRSMTGSWVPVLKDEKIVNAMGINAFGNTYSTGDYKFTSVESYVYELGKYATVSDFVAWLQSIGFNGTMVGTIKDSTTVTQFLISKYGFGSSLKAAFPQVTSYNGIYATSTTTTSSVDALKTATVNSESFNAYTYYTRYTDLQNAIGADANALYQHWMTYGQAEGRTAI